MASVKNINSDYTINCNQVSGATGNASGSYLGTFTINAANIILNGGVTNVQPSVTVDPFLTLAENNPGSVTEMGIIATIDATINKYAGLRFDAVSNVWQISSSVSATGAPIAAYANISTSNTTIAGANTQIQFNANGIFGASANLTFDSANTVASRLTLQGVNQYGFVGNAQANLSVVANTSLVFSNPVDAGGTGLYFVSPQPGNAAAAVTDELVSKTKAIIYSIIF